jgi:peptide/nickel transport system permease protein
MKYWHSIVRRLVGMAVSLLGLSIIIFGISRILPGNPARMALDSRATDEQVQELTRELGLNQPVTQQYIEYIQGLLRGDLGQSLVTKRPVMVDIIENLPATLELITVSIVFTILIGIPLGIVAAQNKEGLPDHLTRLFAFVAVSIPGFFIGILFQVVFGYLLNVLPITGRLSPEYREQVVTETGFLLVDTLLAGNAAAHIDAWQHLLLPALALSMAGTGQIMRITRSSMIDIQHEEFVEAERGYGLPDWLVTYKYIFRNASIPTLTILGLIYASLLGNAFLIELVFAWGGLASYGINAVLQNDFNAVVGVTLTIGLAFVTINFAVDLVLDWVDPRRRLGMEGES